MRAEAALADRHAAVRQAARSWHQAGLLSAEGLRGVEADFPDDRVRVGPVLRALLFFFTLVAVYGAGGFVLLLLIESANHGRDAGPLAVSSLFLGLLALFATEFQIGPGRRAQGGSEAATSFAAVTLLLAGVGIWIFGVLDVKSEQGLAPFLLLATLASLAAAWHWGYPLYGALGAAAGLATISAVPIALTPEPGRLVLGVRIAWILLALLGIALLPRVADSRRLPPAQRGIATAALLVLLAGLYLAVEISSFSGYWLEAVALQSFSGNPPPPPAAALRYLSLAATALVPLLTIAWGLRGRRRPVLLLGLVLAGCAGISLRRFIHLAPLWVVLTFAGALLIALALLMRRALDRGEEHELLGFTAEPPLEGKEGARLVELIAATARFTPPARALPAEPGFHGKGGDFGGGGSSSDF